MTEQKKAIPRWTRRAIPLLLLGGMLALLSSCAYYGPAYQAPPPVRVSQIVEWSQQGVPSDEIISRIQSSGTVYRLSAAQLADLRQEGVVDEVLNYMQDTYLQAVAYDASLRDWGYWAPGPGGYFYGGPYYWPNFSLGFSYVSGGHHHHGGGGRRHH